MKRIYYLLSFIIGVATFSACNPLDKTYSDLGAIPVPTAPATTVSLTLSAADYGLLPSADYAKVSLSYKSKDDAALSVPAILASKYPTYGEKSSATVTYGLTNPSIKVADSLFSDVAYTVVNPTDYVAAQAITGTTFKDYSDAQVLLFLTYKYPAPQPNQLSVLTYNYFLSGVTPSSGVLTTDSFLYLNGVWTKIYTVSNAQYASVGHGSFNQFVSGDAANISTYLSSFLNADAAVMATAKFGDVKYVSYNYFQSSPTPSKTYQRVQPLTFDGSKWVTTPTPLTLAFLKTNGKWVADNTIYYTAVAADYKYMGNNTSAGSVAGRANIVSFPDFNISAPTDATYWSDTDIQGALITLLVSKYPTAVTNQKFVLTYVAYKSGVTSNVAKTFQYNGSAFVFVQ